MEKLIGICREITSPIMEIIVIDDGSTDNSREIYKKLQVQVLPFDLRILYNDKNRGASYSRNRGASESRGEILIFIDSDVIFTPAVIEFLLTKMSTGDYDICFPQALYQDGSRLNPLSAFDERRCMNSIMFLIKKKALSRMDMFFDDAIMVYTDDADFFLRAYTLGLKIQYIPEVKIYHPKPVSLSGISYYYRWRHIIYFYLKLHGLVEYHIPFIFYIAGNMITYLLISLTTHHFHGFHMTPVRYRSTRRQLLKYYFQAFGWNRKRSKQIHDRRQLLYLKIKESK